MTEKEAYRVAAGCGLLDSRVVHTGHQYSARPSNFVLFGKYGSRQAVAKILPAKDEKGTATEREANHLEVYGSQLQRGDVRAPKLLHAEWGREPFCFIYECVPEDRRLFPRSMPADGRLESPITTWLEKTFALAAYREYVKAWKSLERIPSPDPKLDSAGFTKTRVERWFNLAMSVEGPLLIPRDGADRCKDILPRLLKAMEDLPMEFQHGHFNNESVIFHQRNIYLVDFAHCGYYPVHYDLAMMVWNLSFHHCWDARIDPERWLQEVDMWARAITEAFGSGPAEIFRVNMVERAMGSILADIGANTTRLKEEREWMYAVWAEVLEIYSAYLPD